MPDVTRVSDQTTLDFCFSDLIASAKASRTGSLTKQMNVFGHDNVGIDSQAKVRRFSSTPGLSGVWVGQVAHKVCNPPHKENTLCGAPSGFALTPWRWESHTLRGLQKMETGGTFPIFLSHVSGAVHHSLRPRFSTAVVLRSSSEWFVPGYKHSNHAANHQEQARRFGSHCTGNRPTYLVKGPIPAARVAIAAAE